MRKVALRTGVLLFATICLGSSVAFATSLGPTAYVQTSDSPFDSLDFSGGFFYLENFEDGLLNTPGLSGSPGGVTSVVFGPSFHDSVDADDGTIDGSGLNGDSWFATQASVAFTFSAGALGALPTHVGLVWTDGPFITPVTFTAFAPDGVTAVCSIAGSGFANSSFSGETAEDRFFGCTDPGGISKMSVTNTLGGGIEVDHVQYGKLGSPDVPGVVPEPASLLLVGTGLATAAVRRRKRS